MKKVFSIIGVLVFVIGILTSSGHVNGVASTIPPDPYSPAVVADTIPPDPYSAQLVATTIPPDPYKAV